MLALGFHLGAYVTETIRAGLTSIRPGQMRAALALGMSQFQAIRTIILPQALIRMLPPLGSLIVIAVKDSAIASVIAVPELLRQSQVVAGKTYRPFEIYTAAMLDLFPDLLPDGARRSTGSTGGSRRSARRESAVTLRLVGRLGQSLAASRGRRASPSILTVATMAIALPGGLAARPVAALSDPQSCSGAATGFVEFFRATPLILQIYWVFYVLPAAFDITLSEFATALVGLSLNVSAFNSETFRAGILSIRRGQWNAALALGMSQRQAMRKIVLPQAALRVLPALASTWVSLFKDTSLVSIIAVADLSYVALKIRSETYRVLEVLTAMAGLYCLMGYPQAKLVDWLHRRSR